jgi:hypothetical protein
MGLPAAASRLKSPKMAALIAFMRGSMGLLVAGCGSGEQRDSGRMVRIVRRVWERIV